MEFIFSAYHYIFFFLLDEFFCRQHFPVCVQTVFQKFLLNEWLGLNFVGVLSFQLWRQIIVQIVLFFLSGCIADDGNFVLFRVKISAKYQILIQRLIVLFISEFVLLCHRFLLKVFLIFNSYKLIILFIFFIIAFQ